MSTWDDLSAYYEDRYRIAAAWSVRPGEKIFLGDKNSRICRFCGQAKPEVSFRKEAHALPESIGNKSLFTYYECDACNQAAEGRRDAPAAGGLRCPTSEGGGGTTRSRTTSRRGPSAGTGCCGGEGYRRGVPRQHLPRPSLRGNAYQELQRTVMARVD
jgi:hypothetical protein